MYLYTDFDQQLVNERVAQFRDQTERYLAGKLSEDEYRPLRLQNGLYVQRYAPMLRIAVPYGLMNSKQLRKVAEVSTAYDRGYAHVSTRQNIQLNWPALEDVPDILAELATVQMHAIQTSGNCIRNTTTDQYAGVVAGEIADPRPTCELIRQWSTFHPEFAFLPRKFKIAVSALEEKDRAATAFHDIGVYIVRNEAGEIGYKIMAGGGLGRTPIIGSVIREFLPREDLIAYLEAVLRVYNLHGRRDNKYKARIKILVKALTPEVFAQKVEAEFEHTREALKIQPEILKKLDEEFTPFAYQDLADEDFTALFAEHPKFKQWFNSVEHLPTLTPTRLDLLHGVGDRLGALRRVHHARRRATAAAHRRALRRDRDRAGRVDRAARQAGRHRAHHLRRLHPAYPAAAEIDAIDA